MSRETSLLALSAQALRQAGCERNECRGRYQRRTQWCLRCRTLDRLEGMGFAQPESPSDREWREAKERGDVFVIEGDVLVVSPHDRKERGCAACEGDPEAHDLHVCGAEPFDRKEQT